MSLRISQSELDIMNVLWAQSPLGASEIVEALDNKKNWSSRTVKTLLSRLVQKGALSTETEGRRYLYTPLVEKEIYAGQAARKLSDRLFGGRAAPLVAHLAEADGLSAQDIEELETLLAQLKK